MSGVFFLIGIIKSVNHGNCESVDAFLVFPTVIKKLKMVDLSVIVLVPNAALKKLDFLKTRETK